MASLDYDLCIFVLGFSDERACIYVWTAFLCTKIHRETEVIPDRMYGLDTDQKIKNALADNSLSFDFRSPGLLCKSKVRLQITI